MTSGHEHEREEGVGLDESELDLLAYLDGELDEERAAAVEARLREDRAYAARLRAMQAITGFLRDDADRVYREAKVDAIVDDVMAKVRAEAKPRLVEVIPVSEIAPPTSRLTRTKKNTVIWVAFGGVVAAAAAMLVWIGGHAGTEGTQPVASGSASAPETVAVVNTTPAPTSKEPVPAVPEPASTVEVEDLEVGQGATVIYSRGDDGASPVVWVTAREGAQ